MFLVGQFQEGQDFPQVAQLLLDDQDVAVLELDLLLLLVSQEVGGDVPAVEAQPVHVLHFVVQCLPLLHCDDPVVAHLLVETGQDVSDLLVPVGGNGRHVEDGFSALHGGGAGRKFLADLFDGQIDAFLEVGGVHSGLDLLVAFLVDGSGQDSGRGGSVSGFIIGLVGDILDEGGSDVGGFVGEVDCLGDCDSVLGDFGRSVALVDEDIPASRAEGDLYGIAELLASFEEFFPGLAAEKKFFGCVVPWDVGESNGSSSNL